MKYLKLFIYILTMSILTSILHADAPPTENNEGVEDINNVDIEKYKERRAIFKKRPKPQNMVFEKRKLQNYLNTLNDKALKKAEYERIKRIHKLKSYIIHLMARNPYPKGLYLNFRGHKRKVSGTVTMANENVLLLKKSKKSRKSKRYKWENIDLSQYVLFLDYFAQMRLKMKEVGATDDERKEQACNDYITAAVFCDWFGMYEEAINYGKKAVKITPSIQPTVEHLLLD